MSEIRFEDYAHADKPTIEAAFDFTAIEADITREVEKIEWRQIAIPSNRSALEQVLASMSDEQHMEIARKLGARIGERVTSEVITEFISPFKH